MRKKIIVGNWKMNNSPSEAHNFMHDLEEVLNNSKIENDWAIAAPYISIPYIMPHSHSNKKDLFEIPLCAQNFYPKQNGAFTGEVSLEMLLEVGIKYAIIGHSERREIFKEDNNFINQKLKHALKLGIVPILAFGETLKEFENNTTINVIQTQLKEGLKDISSKDISKIILAYEPIWAIGTGKTATPEIAQNICKEVRKYIENTYSKDIANKIRIQYGGSVNEKNMNDLIKQPDIDGFLVGGASLAAKSFAKLITIK